eukprot:12637913-Heterocapsa_arctica.AAC.1
MQRHWEMERCVFNYLKDKHRHKEMRSVFERCNEDIHEAEMTALAYYIAAIDEREREHMPL